MRTFSVVRLACFAVLAVLAWNHGPKPVLASSSDSAPRMLPAAQQSLQIRVSSTRRSYACNDGAVQVTGSSDELNLTGHCASLQITGNSNLITVDSVTSIQFTGDSNSVLYKSTSAPTVQDRGTSNSAARFNGRTAVNGNNGDTVVSSSKGESTTVTGGSLGAVVSSAVQAANAASDAATGVAGNVQTVQDDGKALQVVMSRQRITRDCGDGKDVNINGYQNDITLTGSCNRIALNGWGNTLRIEEAASIQAYGHSNTVTWERDRGVSKPAIQVGGGADNSVRHVTASVP